MSGNIRQSESTSSGSLGLRFAVWYVGQMPGAPWLVPCWLLFVFAESACYSGFQWIIGLWAQSMESSSCGSNGFEYLACQLFGDRTAEGISSFLIWFCTLLICIRALSWGVGLYYLTAGARSLHRSLVRSLGKVRMTFFDQHSLGQIHRRFTGDYDQVAGEIPLLIPDIVASVVSLGWYAVMVGILAPSALVIVFPAFVFMIRFQRLFISAAREVQRLIKVQEGKIWGQVAETLGGLTVVRSFGRGPEFQRHLASSWRELGFASILLGRMNRWMHLRLKLIAEVFSLSLTLVVIFGHATGSPLGLGLSGLLMSLSLGMESLMRWMIHCLAMLETSLVSAERIAQFRALPPEESTEFAPGFAGSGQALEDGLVFHGYTASYRADLPSILHRVSVAFPGGAFTSIVGRTGAGKTSLFQGLVRMLCVSEGGIFYHRTCLHQLPVGEARSLFSVVPQEPSLVAGTLRRNLDLAGGHTDDALWKALALVGLVQDSARLPEGLDTPVLEHGANLSQGERQLVCIARAALRDAPIVLMDEATASSDPVTDARVQEAVGRAFARKTVLVIAHRMSTVRQSPWTLWLEAGRVREFAPTDQVIDRLEAEARREPQEILG